MTRAILLGPIGEGAVLTAAVEDLGVDGPLALVTAGWEAGERNDSDVDRHLGGGSRNLGLYGRWLDVLETDIEYAAAERQLRLTLTDLRDVYLLRLRNALASVAAVSHRYGGAHRRAGAELDEAIADVHALDSRHEAAMVRIRGEFYAGMPPHERESIAAHREAVATLARDCAAVAVAGGQVGVLADCLHLFNIGALLEDLPLVAWSSRSMAVAERIVVADDADPALRPDEVYDTGIGLVRGVVPLPSAGQRLVDDGAERLMVLARRCAPLVCVLLDEGDRLDWNGPGHSTLDQVRVIGPDGAVRRGAEAA